MSPSDGARDHGKADNQPCCPVSVLPDEHFQSKSLIMSLSCLSFFVAPARWDGEPALIVANKNPHVSSSLQHPPPPFHSTRSISWPLGFLTFRSYHLWSSWDLFSVLLSPFIFLGSAVLLPLRNASFARLYCPPLVHVSEIRGLVSVVGCCPPAPRADLVLLAQ